MTPDDSEASVAPSHNPRRPRLGPHSTTAPVCSPEGSFSVLRSRGEGSLYCASTSHDGHSMPPGAPAAATISVRATLDLLDTQFAPVAEGVADDRYAFWLGSGISLGRVDGVKHLVPRVLEFLRERINPGDATCRFRKALNEALSLALSPTEITRVDLGRPFIEWPEAEAIVGRLSTNYARLLDITVDGEKEDFLLWEGVNVRATYADPAIPPDVEHLCIVLLALEGVASEVATANWDGLIERAAGELAPGQELIRVCVRAEDLRERSQRVTLFKFHGCAVRATADEATYRPLLIARQSQINGWAARHETQPMLRRLLNVLIAKPTIMLGLSAQDANIQAIFAEAEDTMPWPWPAPHPAYVFSEDALGVDQRGLLKNVYRASYTPATRQQICSGALIQAYAKPLLISLVLHVLCAKLRKLIGIAPGKLGAADREELGRGVLALRNKVAEGAEPNLLGFVEELQRCSARVLTIFREGKIPPATRQYQPIHPSPVHQMVADFALPSLGLRELAIAVGLLGRGIMAGEWTLAPADPGVARSGALRAIGTIGSPNIFFVVNSHAALCLRHEGHVSADDDAILIHGAAVPAAMARSPRGAPGRTGRVGLREVSIAALLNEVENGDVLLQRFREEVAL